MSLTSFWSMTNTALKQQTNRAAFLTHLAKKLVYTCLNLHANK